MEDSTETSEPTDEEIGDVEDAVTDINDILNFFQQVLANHEQAIAILAAAVFGEANESPVSDESATTATDQGAEVVSEGESNVIPITTDITGTIES